MLVEGSLKKKGDACGGGLGRGAIRLRKAPGSEVARRVSAPIAFFFLSNLLDFLVPSLFPTSTKISGGKSLRKRKAGGDAHLPRP